MRYQLCFHMVQRKTHLYQLSLGRPSLERLLEANFYSTIDGNQGGLVDLAMRVFLGDGGCCSGVECRCIFSNSSLAVGVLQQQSHPFL